MCPDLTCNLFFNLMEMYLFTKDGIDVNGGSVGTIDQNVEQTRGQRQTGRNDLPGKVRELLNGW